MEGQIFTPEGSAILNEIVILFWVAVLITLISTAVEFIWNVKDNRK